MGSVDPKNLSNRCPIGDNPRRVGEDNLHPRGKERDVARVGNNVSNGAVGGSRQRNLGAWSRGVSRTGNVKLVPVGQERAGSKPSLAVQVGRASKHVDEGSFVRNQNALTNWTPAHDTSKSSDRARYNR